MIVGILAGCTTLTPRENPWVDLEYKDTRVTQIRALPLLPELSECIEGMVCMSIEDLDRLEEYKIIAEGNTEIGSANTVALEQTIFGYNELVLAGDSEFQLAELYRRMLEEERSARLWDKILYGSLALLGVLSAVY